MAKHLKFEADEVIPRFKSEFDRAMNELSDAEENLRDQLDVVGDMLRG